LSSTTGADDQFDLPVYEGVCIGLRAARDQSGRTQICLCFYKTDKCFQDAKENHNRVNRLPSSR
jgi:hypothetical protein